MGIGLTEEHRDLARALADWAAGAGTTGLTKDSEERGPGLRERLGRPRRVRRGGHPGAGGARGCGRFSRRRRRRSRGVRARDGAGAAAPTLLAAVVLASEKEVLAAVADASVCVGVGMGDSTVTVEAGRAYGEASLLWGARTTTRVLVPTAGQERLLVPIGGGVRVRGGAGRRPLLSRRHGAVRGRAGGRRRPAAARCSPGPRGGGRARRGRGGRDRPVVPGRRRSSTRRCASSSAGRSAASRRSSTCAPRCWRRAESVDRRGVGRGRAPYDDDADAVGVRRRRRRGGRLRRGAVEVAKDCIQVLGGIGFTCEHDAHLYLRRAMALRGSCSATAGRVAGAAGRPGRRRRTPSVAAGARRAATSRVRGEVRAARRGDRRALPDDERRAALAEAGLPHAALAGAVRARAPAPVEQLVIDEELAPGRRRAARPGHRRRGRRRRSSSTAPTSSASGSCGRRCAARSSWCQLFSEPGAGSDLASLRTTRRAGRRRLAADRPEGLDLAGRAGRLGDLPGAHRTPTRRSTAASPTSSSTCATPGIEVRPLRELTGEALFNEVFLDDVFVPDDCVVGEVDGGWRLARTTLANERVAMAAAGSGSSVERALADVGRRPTAPGRWSGAARARRSAPSADCAKCSALRSHAAVDRGPGARARVERREAGRGARRQDSAELALELLRERACWARRGTAAVRRGAARPGASASPAAPPRCCATCRRADPRPPPHLTRPDLTLTKGMSSRRDRGRAALRSRSSRPPFEVEPPSVTVPRPTAYDGPARGSPSHHAKWTDPRLIRADLDDIIHVDGLRQPVQRRTGTTGGSTSNHGRLDLDEGRFGGGGGCVAAG